jgi:hypothetical protein
MIESEQRSRLAAPEVSVILPTYQRRELVKRAVASVLAQTYRDFELIVVDDGSTDGTREALDGIDQRLRYEWQPNRGVSAARNVGIGLARGSIVAFLDSDNRWLPDHLAALTEMLARHPEAVLASTCPHFIVAGREQPRDARLFDSWERLFVQAASIGFVSCLAVRHEALIATGGFDEGMRTAEDTDLLRRLRCFGPFAMIRRRTIVRQTTSGSLEHRARRAGHYLDDYVRSGANLAAAAEGLPEPQRGVVSKQARGLTSLAHAMIALDRGEAAALELHLQESCRMLPLSTLPRTIESRTRRHLTTQDADGRLRALTMLAELWPHPNADTPRYLRVVAIGIALRLGRPRHAARLLAGWGRGGTFRFAWRTAPALGHRLRRRWQERCHSGRESAELAGEKTVR